jgi:dTDP-4-dehydrorhamnose 3,5-epimerase-like enzyme
VLEGVRVVPLVSHIDDRGFLYEVIHSTDEYLPKFGQTYVVGSPARGTIRGFHRHDLLWDYFHVIRGAGKFIVVKHNDDDVKEASAAGKAMEPDQIQSFVLSERQPALLIVPPGHWHGWMSLEDNTVVVSTGSEVYNSLEPDELRVSPGVFGDVWAVKGR